MRALAAALMLALTPPAARADGPPDPPRLAGEVLASATTGVLHGVGESGYGFRLGLGGEGAAPAAWGDTRTAAWLVTAAWRRESSDGGVPVDEARIGLGFRLRAGRLGVGGDAELLRVAVHRASRSGTIVATGVAVRLVGGLDAVRLGEHGAIVVTLDVGVASVGALRSPAYEPTISLSAGLRF